MYLFDKRKALIAWDVIRDQPRIIKEFIVFEKEPGDREPNFVRKLPFTTGNCCSDWERMTEIEATIEVLRIFITHDFESVDMRKHCLEQCCQIKELVHLRKMVNNMFYNDLTLKEFEEMLYGEEI